MNFANIDIKKQIAESGYTQKQIANRLGITPEWFSRILKKELSEYEKSAIRMAIDGDLSEWQIRHKGRKKGKWIELGKDMYINLENAREQYKALGYPHRNEMKLQCSACNKITMVDESIAYQFCPHCGTDMRGEKDDE